MNSVETKSYSEESLREIVKISMLKGMGTINLISIPFRGIDQGVTAACNVNETTQKICEMTAEGIQTVINIIPKTARAEVKAVINEIHQQLPTHFQQKYGISQDETAYFLESLGYVLRGAVTAGVSSSIVKAAGACKKAAVPTFQSISTKNAYSPYAGAEKQFVRPPKEFIGKLNRDLLVVQYHGVGQASKWFVPAVEANQISTIDQLMSRVALLNKWGERTHVSVARVPAGQEVRFLFGKAKPQKDIFRLEFRPGGAIQYRFHEFNPKWIVETRALPLAVKAKGLQSPASHFTSSAVLLQAGIQNVYTHHTLENLQTTNLYDENPLFESLKTDETPSDYVENKKFGLTASEEIEREVPQETFKELSSDFLKDLSREVVNFSGQVLGVTPSLEELNQLKGIIQAIGKNPQDAPLRIVSKLLQQPESVLNQICRSSDVIIKNMQRFIQNPAGNVMGALAAVGTIMNFMNSVSWVCEFMRRPGKSARDLVKMPYTCVKSCIQLGVSLIKHPEKTSKLLFKSLIKSPECTVKRFLAATGIRRRKKKRRNSSLPTVDPMQQEKLVSKYAEDLSALYFAARSKGFIDPYKTIEDYHHDLLTDWSQRPFISASYFDFPQFLMEKMQENSLVILRAYSPKAHPDSPIISPEILLASKEIEEDLEKMDETFNELMQASQKLQETIHQNDSERESLSKASKKLGEILQDKNKLQQALFKKLKNNQ